MTGIGIGLGPGWMGGAYHRSLGTHVILLAGQSNMVGWADDDGGADYPEGTLQWGRTGTDDSKLIAAVDPLQHHDIPDGYMGLARQFAIDYVAARPGVRLVFVPAAKGGSGFAGSGGDWARGGTLYDDAVDRANAVLDANEDFTFAGILWHQGESERNAENDALLHRSNIDTMVGHMRSDITGAGSAPFVLGGLVPGYTDSDADKAARWDHVERVLADTPNRLAYSGYASASGLPRSGLHFTGAGLRTLGGRYASAFTAALANASPTRDTAAPTITSTATPEVTPGDTTVHTLTASEPATWDISGGTNSSLFTVNAFTGALAYASAAQAGTHAVTVRATDIAGNRATQDITVTVAAGAETGARGHWLLGSDNTTNADLVSGQTLTATGTAPTLNTGYAAVSSHDNGFHTPYDDAKPRTVCFVVRKKAANAKTFLGGTFSSGGWGLFFTSSDRLMVNVPAIGNHELDRVDHNVWVFAALSVGTGSYDAFAGDTADGNATMSRSGTINVASAGTKVGVGRANYSSFGDPIDIAEVIVFDSTKSLTEMAAIYAQSKQRLSARGITLR